jgi:hypothetical protein
MDLDQALRILYPELYKETFNYVSHIGGTMFFPYNGPEVNDSADNNDLFTLYLAIKKKYPNTTFDEIDIDNGTPCPIKSLKETTLPCRINIWDRDMYSIIKKAESSETASCGFQRWF